MLIRRKIAFTLSIACVFIASLISQEPRTPYPKIKIDFIDTKVHSPSHLAVKFVDDCGLRASGGLLQFPNNRRLGLDSEIARLAPGSWAAMHHDPIATLEAIRVRATAGWGRVTPDLTSFFILTLSASIDIVAAARDLQSLPEVECAWPLPWLTSELLPSRILTARAFAPGNYQPSQLYLGPTISDGMGISSLWSLPGGAGELVNIADVEGWWATHDDLPTLTTIGGITSCPTPPFCPEATHGTNVLGIMAARNDGLGITGIAHNARFFFSSVGSFVGGLTPANIAAAIIAIGTNGNISAGDVVLIEVQVPYVPSSTDPLPPPVPSAASCPDANQGFLPAEYDASVHAAITTLTGLGIVVFEAAGNGSQDLDDMTYANALFNFTDSGAIMVGAACSPTTPAGVVPAFTGSSTARSRICASNFGRRVDMQGWGENIITTVPGFGLLGCAPAAYYTPVFGNTSGATPMVAGVGAILQSIYRTRSRGAVLTSFQMRYFLRETGMPQTAGTYPISQEIGRMPDAPAAEAAIDTVTILSIGTTSIASGTTGPVSVAIVGSGFSPSTIAYWNGAVRTTTFTSSTNISIALSTADLATAGLGFIRASTPIATSTSSPAPMFSYPSTILLHSNAVELVVTGAGSLGTCSAGGPNASSVVKVNLSTGGTNRTVNVDQALPFLLTVDDMPSAAGAQFVLFAYFGVPTPAEAIFFPGQVDGTLCFTPMCIGGTSMNPDVAVAGDLLSLFCPPLFPLAVSGWQQSIPALMTPGPIVVQGLISDPGAAGSLLLSFTNAVRINVQ